MHVLIVAGSFPFPGNLHKQPFIKEQVLQLCKRVERVTVLCPTARFPSFCRKLRGERLASVPVDYSLIDGKCNVVFPRFIRAPRYWFLNWTKAQWCRLVEKTVIGFEKSHPVSLIHAHTGDVNAWASLVVSRRHGIPLVVTYHGDDVNDRLVNRRKGWQMCRDTFQYAHLNLPVSRGIEGNLRRHAEPEGRCETLLLGVDQAKFFPSTEPKQEKTILFAGRVTKEKGIFDLLLAVEQVKGVCPDVMLTVVGGDWTGGEFSKRVAALNLGDSVRMLGALPIQLIPDVMRKSSLFCLPSYGEGTPVSVMEAMSCALPIVATRVGGIPDIVAHNQTGLLVDKGDIQGLAAAIILLLSKPGEMTRLSHAALKFACEHFDGEKSTDRLVKLYDELVVSSSKRKKGLA
jgi:glycosyltransferase involved in cell wall biosynthesis